MRILIADDGSADGERVMAAMTPWVDSTNIDVDVLRVLKPGSIRTQRSPAPPATSRTRRRRTRALSSTTTTRSCASPKTARPRSRRLARGRMTQS